MTDTKARRGCPSEVIKESTREIGKLQNEIDEQGKIKYKRDTSIRSLFQKHNFFRVFPSVTRLIELEQGLLILRRTYKTKRLSETDTSFLSYL
ncbi:hypothetical protein C5167_029738 [Papaver somniferum]|nr:hypothetical protein C5167_029738 [Papaver somniferum]